MSTPRQALVAAVESLRGMGGLARVAQAQARALQELGWTVTAITPDSIARPWRSRRYPMLDLFLISCQISAQARNLSGATAVLFSHGMCGAFGARGTQIQLFHGTCAALAVSCRSRLTRAEYAIVRHLNGLLEGRSGRRARSLAVSASVAEEARLYYGVPNTRVLHNAVDVAHFAPNGGRETSRAAGEIFRGLVVGRVDYGKGRETIRALGCLLDDGYGMDFASPQIQGDAGWGDSRARFLGPVAYEEMPEVYRSAHYLLCPSRYEGFGLTLIEAWACGIPVVTTNVGIIRELRGQEPTLDQMVVDDPDDVDGFAERIRLLRDNPELGARQAQWGRAVVAERFSGERYRAAWRQLVEQCAA